MYTDMLILEILRAEQLLTFPLVSRKWMDLHSTEFCHSKPQKASYDGNVIRSCGRTAKMSGV